MDAVAEREVRVGIAPDVEGLRVGELRRVAVGRAHQQQDPVAGLDRLIGNRHVLARDSHRPLQRAVVAQALLDAGLHVRRLVAQQAELLGQPQERRQRVADQVLGRLVAGVDEQDARVQHVVAGQRRVVALDLHQPAHHVVARVFHPLVVEPGKEGLELDQRVLRPVHSLVLADTGEQQRGQAVGPLVEAVHVFARRADD